MTKQFFLGHFGRVGVIVLAFFAATLHGEEKRTKLPPALATPPELIQAPPGFKVERLYSVPQDKQGSWVAMAVDPKGRLIVSDQNGGLFRVTPPPIGQSGEPKVEPLKAKIIGAQGLLCAFDSLYVMVNSNKFPSGLYRLRDTDGDDQYDEVKMIRAIDGQAREHGPHAIVPSPDGKSLYICAGNFTAIPDPETSRAPRLWQEDQLLPRMPDAGGHDPHVMAPAGWIAKIDPDGSNCELICTGMRNAYDFTFNHEGEIFAHDSDMEWDVGAPWYRPTRLCHITSGAEWGWRNGSGKFQIYQPDTLPPVIDIGPGSPTGALFGYGAKFPAKYQQALYLLDWTYGVIYMATLKPEGSTYSATLEQFIAGNPLPLTDAVIGKDGAMYFLVGGRQTQSGLYRVTYDGPDSTAPVTPPVDEKAASARAVRHKLEALHKVDPKAIETAWPYLKDQDRFIRYAARVAIEHQPVAEWRAKALAETDTRTALVSLLALARAGDKTDLPALLQSLEKIDYSKLDEASKLELLRVYTLAFCRMGKPDEAAQKGLAAKFSALFPTDSVPLNRELSTLMIFLDAPDAISKLVAQLEKAPTQDEQIQYAMVLRVAKGPWTMDQRKKYFNWFHQAEEYRGGHSFLGFLKNMKTEAIATLSDDEKKGLGKLLARRKKSDGPAAPPRPLVKEYTMADLVPLLETRMKGRNYENGRKMFSVANCSRCHRFNLEGGIGGPDLSMAAGRFSARDLLESVIDPSKVISDQYQATVFVVNGRQIVGRLVNQNVEKVMVAENLLEPDKQTTFNRKDLEETMPSKLSMMPVGLLNTLSEDEVLDLVAYLLSKGDKNNAIFH